MLNERQEIAKLILDAKKQSRPFIWMGVEVMGNINPDPPESLATDSILVGKTVVRIEKCIKRIKGAYGLDEDYRKIILGELEFYKEKAQVFSDGLGQMAFLTRDLMAQEKDETPNG